MPPSPDTTPVSDILARANAALDRGAPDQALALLQPLRDSEAGAGFFACLIEALLLQREFDEAEATVSHARSLHPGDAGILHAAGLISFHTRDHQMADQRLRAPRLN